MSKDTNEIVYAVKDKEELYFIGYNQWDKQVRKAKLYRSYKMAEDVKNDSRFVWREAIIVKVQVREIDDEEEQQGGTWIETKNGLTIREFKCSICGHSDNKHTAIRGHYCWYCGSKMNDMKYLEE